MLEKNIILEIDTSETGKTKVALLINKKNYEKKEASPQLKSQAVLLLIEEILKEKRLSLEDLSEIRVCKGPGSFTGLRVGIAIASTLGWLLNIPVNGKKNSTIEPVYK